MSETPQRNLFLLVGGWPASGKSTLARTLSEALGLALIAKDEVKQTLMAELGRPRDVADSQRLGRAAMKVALRVARDCQGAVIDGTWLAYSRPLVGELPGRLVEVRCIVTRATARQRFRARQRDEGHLDDMRDDAELWGDPVPPLGVGPLVEVDTSGRVDTNALVCRLRIAGEAGQR